MTGRRCQCLVFHFKVWRKSGAKPRIAETGLVARVSAEVGDGDGWGHPARVVDCGCDACEVRFVVFDALLMCQTEVLSLLSL